MPKHPIIMRVGIVRMGRRFGRKQAFAETSPGPDPVKDEHDHVNRPMGRVSVTRS